MRRIQLSGLTAIHISFNTLSIADNFLGNINGVKEVSLVEASRLDNLARSL